MSVPPADAAAGPVATAPAPGCANCGHALPDPRPAFCPACGQETELRPPKLGEFLQQFAGAYLSTEGALWRTLRLLLLRPGELTRRYLAGQRKHYVLPLRLYLTISVVVLLALRVLGQAGLEQPAVRIEPAERPSIELDLGIGRAGLQDGRFFCEGLPRWFCQRLQRRIDLEPQALAREAHQLGERFMSNLGAAMFVLLPAFALLLKLAYLNRGLRYTEHLVFALHLHAFWFFAFALTLLFRSWLEAAAWLAIPVYALLALRRVYGGRLGPRLLRAAFVSAGYLAALLVTLTGVALWSLLF
jgi:hypothetical protein